MDHQECMVEATSLEQKYKYSGSEFSTCSSLDTGMGSTPSLQNC